MLRCVSMCHAAALPSFFVCACVCLYVYVFLLLCVVCVHVHLFVYVLLVYMCVRTCVRNVPMYVYVNLMN